MLTFKCPSCGCRKFRFTACDETESGHHGAVCAQCKNPLTIASCFPYSAYARQTDYGAGQAEQQAPMPEKKPSRGT
jgi:predicted  nucleic acid-binding Zn-ribbon protein